MKKVDIYNMLKRVWDFFLQKSSPLFKIVSFLLALLFLTCFISFLFLGDWRWLLLPFGPIVAVFYAWKDKSKTISIPEGGIEGSQHVWKAQAKAQANDKKAQAEFDDQTSESKKANSIKKDAQRGNSIASQIDKFTED